MTTDVLEDVVYDKEFSTNDSSSVVDHVYYSTKDRLLFVQLMPRNDESWGVLCGYKDVSPDVYTALWVHNDNRLSGDSNSSVGRYWNQFVKNHYEGVDTDDLSLYTPEEWEAHQAGQERLRSLIAKTRDVFAQDNTKSEPVDLDEPETTEPECEPAEKQRFVVAYSEKSGNLTFGSQNMNVNAYSMDDALYRFNKAVELLGWEAKVHSVTLHFGY